MFVASKYGQNKVIGLDVIELKVCKTVFLKGHISGDWVVYQIVEDPRLTKLLSKSLEIFFLNKFKTSFGGFFVLNRD